MKILDPPLAVGETYHLYENESSSTRHPMKIGNAGPRFGPIFFNLAPIGPWICKTRAEARPWSVDCRSRITSVLLQPTELEASFSFIKGWTRLKATFHVSPSKMVEPMIGLRMLAPMSCPINNLPID